MLPVLKLVYQSIQNMFNIFLKVTQLHFFQKLKPTLQKKKPAAQAASADPSRCTPPMDKIKQFSQKWCNFDILWDLECPEPVLNNLVYGCITTIWLYVSVYFIWRSHTDQCDVYDIHGYSLGFCFPWAPSSTTIKVCPNLDLWLCGLSNYMSHSWLSVHPELTRWCFHELLY